jgi:aryl-alcohol dehydrogenase-like predicted oxidoreductase
MEIGWKFLSIYRVVAKKIRGVLMRIRELGKSNIKIGEVGLGCWQLGGDSGPMDEKTAFSIMKTAVENGATFFDTADIYGGGRSEKLIGQFMRSCDVPITVATKFGQSADVFPDKYTKEKLIRTVQESLQRLEVDTLDLLQLHCVPPDVLKDGEIFDWLREIKNKGLIKNFGASVESIEEALICLDQKGLVSLQVIFNIFRQKLIKDLFHIVKDHGVGIIVRLPVASGLLTGKFTTETKFSETDHRHFNRDGQYFNVGETFAGLPFEKGVELSDSLKELVPEGLSMTQMALRWILDYDEVSVVIPGASSSIQVKENTTVSDLKPLPEELHDELRQFYDLNVHSHIRGPY